MRIADSVLLTYWPPAPEALYVSICRSGGLDLDLDVVFDLRQHRDRGGARMDASLRFGRGHALHAMHARLVFEVAVRLVALDARRRSLYSRRPRSGSPKRARSSCRFASAKRMYMRARSPAKIAASSPPVPARISTKTSLASLGSRGDHQARELGFELGLALAQARRSLLRRARAARHHFRARAHRWPRFARASARGAETLLPALRAARVP